MTSLCFMCNDAATILLSGARSLTDKPSMPSSSVVFAGVQVRLTGECSRYDQLFAHVLSQNCIATSILFSFGSHVLYYIDLIEMDVSRGQMPPGL